MEKITLNVPPELVERFDKNAKARHKTRSEAIREAMVEWVIRKESSLSKTHKNKQGVVRSVATCAKANVPNADTTASVATNLLTAPATPPHHRVRKTQTRGWRSGKTVLVKIATRGFANVCAIRSINKNHSINKNKKLTRKWKSDFATSLVPLYQNQGF